MSALGLAMILLAALFASVVVYQFLALRQSRRQLALVQAKLAATDPVPAVPLDSQPPPSQEAIPQQQNRPDSNPSLCSTSEEAGVCSKVALASEQWRQRLEIFLEHQAAMSDEQQQRELGKLLYLAEQIELLTRSFVILQEQAAEVATKVLDLRSLLEELRQDPVFDGVELHVRAEDQAAPMRVDTGQLTLLLRMMIYLCRFGGTAIAGLSLRVEARRAIISCEPPAAIEQWLSAAASPAASPTLSLLSDHCKRLAVKLGADFSSAQDAQGGLGLQLTGDEVENHEGQTGGVESSSHLPGDAVILVIDDAMDTHNLIRVFLSQRPWYYQAATTAADGLQFLEEHKADIILVDLNMPDVDGLETIQKIRALEQASQRSAAVVLLFTASEDEADHAKAREAGCCGFLPKPLTKDKLLTTLESYLGGKA